MPFFISKTELEAIRAVAFRKGEEEARSKWSQRGYDNGVSDARRSMRWLTEEEITGLAELVPGVKEYTYSSLDRSTRFDFAKLREDSADLKAYKAAERGAKIALTLAGDTADYAKALKEEGK